MTFLQIVIPFRAFCLSDDLASMHAFAQQIEGRETHYEDVGRTILTGAPSRAAAA